MLEARTFATCERYGDAEIGWFIDERRGKYLTCAGIYSDAMLVVDVHGREARSITRQYEIPNRDQIQRFMLPLNLQLAMRLATQKARLGLMSHVKTKLLCDQSTADVGE